MSWKVNETWVVLTVRVFRIFAISQLLFEIFTKYQYLTPRLLLCPYILLLEFIKYIKVLRKYFYKVITVLVHMTHFSTQLGYNVYNFFKITVHYPWLLLTTR